MKERGFSHTPQRQDATGDAQILGRSGESFVARPAVPEKQFGGGVRRPEIVRVDRDSGGFELVELVLADFDLLRVFFAGGSIFSHQIPTLAVAAQLERGWMSRNYKPRFLQIACTE